MTDFRIERCSVCRRHRKRQHFPLSAGACSLIIEPLSVLKAASQLSTASVSLLNNASNSR